MAAVQAFNATEFLNSLASLAVAFLLGMLIGSERQYRQRTAGLRTNVLVSVGAAAFVDLGMRLTGNPGAVQVVAYFVSGAISIMPASSNASQAVISARAHR